MEPQHVQTKREIESLLSECGLRPRTRFGQHFLIDGNLMRRLAASAELHPEDVVLEVGAGTGGLTDLLLASGAQVIAVEIDRELFELLHSRFEPFARLTLLSGDVLAGKHELNPDVHRILSDVAPGPGGHVKLVANLPYQVATPLIMNLLLHYPRVRRLCFTVQTEVGRRLTAHPGSRDFGPLGIITQLLCDIHLTARVGPQSFWPRPTVDSVMLRMDVVRQPFFEEEDLRSFAALVRATFDHRRKVLRTALSYAITQGQLDRAGEVVDLGRRPEQLTIEEWLEVYKVVKQQSA